jgi:hypothetical protein
MFRIITVKRLRELEWLATRHSAAVFEVQSMFGRWLGSNRLASEISNRLLRTLHGNESEHFDDFRVRVTRVVEYGSYTVEDLLEAQRNESHIYERFIEKCGLASEWVQWRKENVE